MSRFNDFQTDDRAAEIINGEIGLLGVQNNFNVGITRAKFGLIIIGINYNFSSFVQHEII